MSTTPRFFVPPDAILGDTALLPPDVLHHARNVLRLRSGEPLILHDGNNRAYETTLPDGKGATATITHHYELNTEPTIAVTIAQALPKTSDKVEQVLQHGTEIGATAFVFFQSERSVARMEARDKIEKRLERWQEIIKNAAEQSRRGILPTVTWEPRLTNLLPRLAAFDQSLILHESASTALIHALPSTDTDKANITPANNMPPNTPPPLLPTAYCLLPSSYCLLVGPEGGFSEGEVSSMVGAGGKAVHLGPRILRTETAALVALSQLLCLTEKG